MVIRHNLLAMNASRQIGLVNKKQRKNIERLSSGYGINRTADDVAGLQSGAEAGDGIYLNITAMSSKALGLCGLNVEKEETALESIDLTSAALRYVMESRSGIGAEQNRLEHTINNEANIVENTTAAESQIRDANMAEIMVSNTLSNVLLQAGQFMLAQANQSAQGVMSILG